MTKKKGETAAKIFEKEYLQYLGIPYRNTQNIHQFQVMDVDFKDVSGLLYEVKGSYKDNERVCIEAYTNINPDYGSISRGWLHKSQAGVFAFISSYTFTTILVRNTEGFRNYMEQAEKQNKYEMKLNNFSQREGRLWQSAYWTVPLIDIVPYVSIFKRPHL